MLGVAALSPSSETPWLAYPSGGDGAVQVFNTVSLQPVCAIQAHRTAINKLAFDFEGTMLATASDRGTILRVFSLPSGKKLHQFRRGTYPATIYSLSFSLNSSMLCVSSDSDTVHIFKVHPESDSATEPEPIDAPNTTGRQAMLAAFLPERLGEAIESTRDFCHLKLPSSGVPSLVAMVDATVMVIMSTGVFLVYKADLALGGECSLLRRYALQQRRDRGEQASIASSNYSL